MEESMKKELAKADKEVLVEIVKFAQKHGLKGASGGWKEFLNCYDRRLGDHVSDPSRRSAEILVAFLKTLSGEDDLKIISNFLRKRRNLRAVLRRIEGSKEEETPVQRLVRLTIEHPKYVQRYTFPSQNKDWVVIPLRKVSKAMKSNKIIAVDCEMVLCEDGTEEVVRVCAIDQNSEVKVNMLVKPKKAIIDYRTHITGLSAKDLDGTTYSLIDAQKSLKKLLRHGTVLAGHGLHNDLQALKIDHAQVIDTGHIFRRADSKLSTPSLKDLCKSILGYELRQEGEPHDCLRDAEATLKLVLAKLEHGLDNPIEIASTEVTETGCKRLLIHRIPVDVPYKELLGLFSGKYDFDLQGELKRCGKTYSTFMLFKDAREAEEAFREIEGTVIMDTSGRPQKLVSFELSTGQTTSFYIRNGRSINITPNHETANRWDTEDDESEDLKVVKGRCVEDEIKFIVASMKRCSELEHEDGPQTKKRNAESDNEDLKKAEDHAGEKSGGFSTSRKTTLCQCKHLQEIDRLRQELEKRDHEISKIERLKQELGKREDEIFELQKIVHDLTSHDLHRS